MDHVVVVLQFVRRDAEGQGAVASDFPVHRTVLGREAGWGEAGRGGAMKGGGAAAGRRSGAMKEGDVQRSMLRPGRPKGTLRARYKRAGRGGADK